MIMKHGTCVSGALLAVITLAGCTAPDQDTPGPVRIQTPTAAPSTSVTPVPAAPPGTMEPTPVAPVWVQAAEERVPVPSPTPPAAAPSTAAPVKPTVRPSAAPTRPAAPTPRASTAKPSMTRPATSAAPSKAPGNTLRIGAWSHGYVTSHSQGMLDACHVVEWDPLWFAGHDWCGYAFWANVGVGTKIVLTGKNAGEYTVTQRVYLPYQGGNAPHFSDRFDLVLQTCKGSGTQLIMATKTG